MKLSTIFLLLIFSLSINSVSASQAISKSGQVFTNIGAATNLFRFKPEELRDEVSAQTSAFINRANYSRYEEDTLNYNVGIGYYLNEKVSFLFNYNPDLSFGDFEGILAGIVIPIGDDSDVHLDIYDFEFHYRFLDFTENFYLFSNLGISHHRVEVRNYSGIFSHSNGLISTERVNDTSLKVGIGAQWDFNRRLGLKVGFTKSDFLSTEKAYAHMEFRF